MLLLYCMLGNGFEISKKTLNIEHRIMNNEEEGRWMPPAKRSLQLRFFYIVVFDYHIKLTTILIIHLISG
jgi:hypothetical protein